MATINSIAGRVGLEGLDATGPPCGPRVLLVDELLVGVLARRALRLDA